jgi:hypothetical protein
MSRRNPRDFPFTGVLKPPASPEKARELCITVHDKILPILEEAGLPNRGFYFWGKIRPGNSIAELRNEESLCKAHGAGRQ